MSADPADAPPEGAYWCHRPLVGWVAMLGGGGFVTLRRLALGKLTAARSRPAIAVYLRSIRMGTD